MEIYWCTAGCSARFVSECRERGGDTGRNIYLYLGIYTLGQKLKGLELILHRGLHVGGKSTIPPFLLSPIIHPSEPGREASLEKWMLLGKRMCESRGRDSRGCGIGQ